ncbi:MAG: response regulator, partial [Bacteroidota bacterium]
ERLRADDDLRRLPLLILSGSDKSEDRIRILRLGADDFLVKPFNPEELRARVDNLLRRLG